MLIVFSSFATNSGSFQQIQVSRAANSFHPSTFWPSRTFRNRPGSVFSSFVPIAFVFFYFWNILGSDSSEKHTRIS